MDFVNAVYAACVVFIGFYIFKVPMKYYVFVLLHLLLVFLTNDFLFPVSYMPDQVRYIASSSAMRESMDFLHYYLYDRNSVPGNAANASLVFALFPIPFLHSVFSISIINFILYSFLFIFLYKKKLLVGNALLFYLIFPSFALYAAVGLRDMMILFLMVLSIYMLYRKKILLSILVAMPLLYIKSQNFLILIAALLIYKSVENRNLKSVKTLLKLAVVVLLMIVFTNMFSIEEINFYRRAMYAEDGGIRANYIPIAGYMEFLITGFIGSFYMILKPMIWEVRSPMQLIQSIENIVVFYMIYKIYQEQKIMKDKFITFLFIYFFVGMFIYGLVIFNYGTAARYRFTFEVVFIIFSLNIIHQYRKKSDFKKDNGEKLERELANKRASTVVRLKR